MGSAFFGHFLFPEKKVAKERDVNESDTVTIVTDMLEEIFGFDKYNDITREFSIKGNFCDLAIKSSKSIDYLIEVKAIGLNLSDNHLKQAVNYASHQGIKWVVLTNGMNWNLYRVIVDNKVDSELMFSINFEDINIRKSENQELLYLLCKRGIQKELIDDFYEYKQSVNKYTLGAILVSEPVISTVKRELRKIKTGIKVTNDEISSLIEHEILKRDILDSDSGKEALKNMQKILKQQQRTKKREALKNITP